MFACVDISQQLCDGVAREGVLEVVCQFRVAVGHVLLLFGRLHQRIYDVSQDVKRFIDAAPLPQPLPFNVGVFHPLAAGQIDHVQLGPSHPHELALGDLALDHDCEDSVRAGRFAVHHSARHPSRSLPIEQQSHCALVAARFCFSQSLHEDASLGVLPDLVHALVGGELHRRRGTRSKICSL